MHSGIDIEKFEGYTPQPHQGHEFGDVSMLVNLHGRNMTFCGAAKTVVTFTVKKTVNIARTVLVTFNNFFINITLSKLFNDLLLNFYIIII